MYSKRGTIVKHTPFDESLYLGTKWASDIGKLNHEQQILAKKAINDILFEAKMKRLNINAIKINGCCPSDVSHSCEYEDSNHETKRSMLNNKKRKRKIWMNECFKRRNNSVEESPTVIDTTISDYENIFKMKPSTFEELLQLVTPFIKKADTLMRYAIPPRQRLAATLHFLVSGKILQDLKEITNIAPQTLRSMIIETCEAIIVVLNDYVKTPQTSEEWMNISNNMENEWNFPHCLGAIGGVHIKVPKIRISESTCLTHKNKCSAVLLAITDSQYKFILIDIRPNIQCDFEDDTSNKINYNSRIFSRLHNIPEAAEISNTNYKLPYVFITESMLDLSDKIMKPYIRKFLSNEQLIYNYRLNRVNKTVQNAIGMMSSQFRVLLNSIRFNNIEKSLKVVKVCCYLHNYLITKNENIYQKNQVDLEDVSTGLTQYAEWRSDQNQLTQIHYDQSKKNSYSSILIRNKFCEYLNGVGSLSWQNLFISQETTEDMITFR